MNQTEQPLAYAHANRVGFVAELKEFVRFPSISAQPKHADDVRRCADWLANHLSTIGLEVVRVLHTAGHPAVYGEWLHAADRPTVLIYGHYDVQPADPLSDWQFPPFQPEIRGDYLFGRGASDDKGQLFCHIKAIECYLETIGHLPVNVKCLFEGEEEIGSPNLVSFISQNPDAVKADVVLVSDTQMLTPRQPVLTYGLRGALGMELEVTGPRSDLHAGVFGGAVHNPAQALCEIVAGLHDSSGRVAIAGFYDDVRQVSGQERMNLTGTGSPSAFGFATSGTHPNKEWGEAGYSPTERTTIRPALTINGISSGYLGNKAIIPRRASAKLSFRLVPNQNPAVIGALFRAHLIRETPRTVQTALRTVLKAQPVVTNLRNRFIRAASVACRRAFGAQPVFVRSGGTIPAVSIFHNWLRLPSVLMGFGLPGDHIHAPNERFYLPNFQKGIEASIHFLAEVRTQRSLTGGQFRNHRAGADDARRRQI